MPNWRRKTRALEKAKLRIMINGENPQNKLSRWALKRMRRDEIGPYHMWGSKLWRNQTKWRNRKRQKEIRQALADFARYPYIEDCRYHPCKVTKVDVEHGVTGYGSIDFECESLVNGTTNACSYFHCGIIHLTEEEGRARVAVINEMGMFPYQLQYVYGVEKSEDVRSILCDLIQTEKIWKFNENGPAAITENGKDWIKDKYGIDYGEIIAECDIYPIDEETQE